MSKFIPIRLSKHRQYLYSRPGQWGCFDYFSDTTHDRMVARQKLIDEILAPFRSMRWWFGALWSAGIVVLNCYRSEGK